MVRKLLLILSLASIYLTPIYATTTVSLRNNPIFFALKNPIDNEAKYIDGVELAKYYPSAHTITHNQPWGGVHQDLDYGIDIKAGRKDDSNNVRVMKSWEINKYNTMPVDFSGALFDAFPTKANFAVIGQLVITYKKQKQTFNNMTVSGAHDGFWGDYYYLGGPSCSVRVKNKVDELTCTSQEGKKFIFSPSNYFSVLVFHPA